MKLEFKNLNIQIALALSAASALIYEVVATHMLIFYSDESSYSIATVLSVFLFGLAIGSLLIHYTLNKIKNKIMLFGILQILIALYAFFILTNLLDIIHEIYEWGIFATSFIILLIPTIFLGAIFPLAGSIFKKDKRETIGLVYSSDLFGAITGSLIAGFILIPQLGSRNAVIFGAGLNIISALIMFSKRQKVIPVLLLFIFLGSTVNFTSVVTDSTDLPYENVYEEVEGYQFYANSPYGLVVVENNRLKIDKRTQCCRCNKENTTDTMIAVYALDPLEKYGDLDVLNIGLGCGLTLEKCLEYNTSADVVEINEQVVEANKVMTDVLKNPRVNLIVNDGLSHLRQNNKKYDSILSDIENPTVVHASNLYTVDAFKIISDSLTSYGTFSLRNFNRNNRFLDILYYSLKEAFPYVYSYSYVFLASKQKLDQLEYVPSTPHEINTIDRNTLTDAYWGGK